jgi:hypothetical protein
VLQIGAPEQREFPRLIGKMFIYTSRL